MGAWRPTWQIRTEMLHAYISTVHIRGMLRFLRYCIDRVPGCPAGDSFLAPCQILLSPRHTGHVSLAACSCSLPLCLPACIAVTASAARARGREASGAAAYAYTGGAKSQTAKSHEPGLELGRVRKRSGCSLLHKAIIALHCACV